MIIEVNTNEPDSIEQLKRLLAFLSGELKKVDAVIDPTPVAEPAAPAKRGRKPAAPPAEVVEETGKAVAEALEPEPESVAIVAEGSATQDDAVSRASELIKTGHVAEVKKALIACGVRKVAELTEFDEFLALLKDIA